MDSPNTLCTMTSHQAIMKCPWQWRQPFLDEKLDSRKRKVGDGYFYDPVDPSFVDHLLPGHAKKFCTERLESEEKEQIAREIERLMSKKQAQEGSEDDADEAIDASANGVCLSLYDSLFMEDDNPFAIAHGFGIVSDDDADRELFAEPRRRKTAAASSSSIQPNRENLALVDSILSMSKAVEGQQISGSAIPHTPPTATSRHAAAEKENIQPLPAQQRTPTIHEHKALQLQPAVPMFERSTSLELVSDNLQENFFASEDADELLSIPTPSTTTIISTSQTQCPA